MIAKAIFLSLLFFTRVAFCSDILTPIFNRYEKLQGIEAAFHQYLFSQSSILLEEAYGKIYLKGGKRFLLLYEKPLEEIVCDGKNIFIYLPKTKEVFKGLWKFSYIDLFMPKESKKAIYENFYVKRVRFGSLKLPRIEKLKNPKLVIMFLPKKKKEFPFSSLYLLVNKKDMIFCVVSLDIAKNRQVFLLDDIREKRLSDTIFSFKIENDMKVSPLSFKGSK